MKTYRVGIIGFGMIGKVHAFGYATLPFYSQPMDAEFRISHVATGHADTAEKAKRICGATVATTDFREITENPEIDIVHVCTPNDRHFEAILSAIRQGKHLYCDKPLSTSLDDAKSIRKEILDENYAATNQMTFHLRFFPAIQRAKQILDEGRLGRIYRFQISYLHSSNASPTAPFKWKHSASGGVVRDLASHLLDLADHLLGPLDSILAETQHGVSRRLVSVPTPDNPTPEMIDVPTEDAVTILARTASGVHGILDATKLATGNEDELTLEINGELGAIRFRLMQPHYLDFFDATTSDRPLGGESGWRRIPCGARFESPDTDFPSPKSTIGWTRAHAACLSNFLHAVVENRPAAPDLLQGFKVDQLIDTVFRSANSRAWTDVR